MSFLPMGGGLLNLDEDQRMALLHAAAGLLQGRGMAQGAAGGLLGFANGLNQSRDSRQRRELGQLQIDAMKRSAQEGADIRSLGNRAFGPNPNLVANDDEGNAIPQAPGGGGMPEFMKGLMGIDPMKGASLYQQMAKENPFGKVEADKFTPESIARFAAAGGKDYSLLVPRVKMEPVNTGGSTTFRNPYNPGPDIPHTLTPGERERIPIERAGLGVQIARARDEGVGGLPGIPGFITGPAPGMPPVTGPTARPAPPVANQPAPIAAPGLSPKQQRELAERNAKELPADMAAFQSVSAALDALGKSASEVRMHPGLAGTSGGLGAFPNMPGSNASNAEALMTTLRAKVAFNALQEMRNASKTGGALGNVTEKEIAYLENSIASLEKTQDVKQRRAQLAKIEAYANAARSRMSAAMRARYGDGVFQQSDPLGIR